MFVDEFGAVSPDKPDAGIPLYIDSNWLKSVIKWNLLKYWIDI